MEAKPNASEFFIQSGRQMGKTYRVMSEIHDLFLASRFNEVLVVFPDLPSAESWMHGWGRRFPTIPRPSYVSIGNILKTRGRFYAKIYVENVDLMPDGIYTDRLQEIKVCLYSPLGDGEIVYTSSLLPLNQRSHNAVVKPDQVLSKGWKRWQEIRFKS